MPENKNPARPQAHMTTRQNSPSFADLEKLYENDRKFIWSVARTLQLLQSFRPGHGSLGNNELSERTGISKATVTRITYTLTELGYLKKDSSRKYYPSPRLLSLSYPVIGNLHVRQLAQGRMQELANLSGAFVALAWPDEDVMIYVAANAATISDAQLMDIGTRVSMARTSTGRAVLSQLPQDQLEEKFDRWSVLYGPEWPELKARILKSIEEIHERGFCLVDGEWRSNIRTIAVPVYDRVHDTYLGLNCGGPAFNLSADELINEYGPRLVHIAQTVA